MIDRVMKKAKFWKILIILSAAVLPFSLIAVGQAQQMTCWCIESGQTEGKSLTNDYPQRLGQKAENVEEHSNSSLHSAENEDTKSISTGAS